MTALPDAELMVSRKAHRRLRDFRELATDLASRASRQPSIASGASPRDRAGLSNPER